MTEGFLLYENVTRFSVSVIWTWILTLATAESLAWSIFVAPTSKGSALTVKVKKVIKQID